MKHSANMKIKIFQFNYNVYSGRINDPFCHEVVRDWDFVLIELGVVICCFL